MASFQRPIKKKGGNEPWRNKERHYCALCNAWMGSDRQSIMLHENGKKHREAVEEDLTRRRDEKKRREKDRKGLEKVFAQVNAAVGLACPPAPSFGPAKPWDLPAREAAPRGGEPLPPTQQKKRARDEPKQSDEKEPANADSNKSTETDFDPNVGHYVVEGTTYLEGGVYCKVLEEGMPIQLWTGSAAALDGEKRDLRNCNKWRVALLAKVSKKKRGDIACHVSYLLNADDEDETIESDVPPSRIRLVLGSDPSIPSTMEEAHLALMGGEQTIHVANGKGAESAAKIDENTGLSGWSTTTIRKVSSHYEQNQEKKRQRQHEREVAERRERKEREIQARRMEEAKHANAHDSALGAYDVWSSSAPGAEGKARAYKGVDVTKEAKLEVADTANCLSKGMGNVAFKKKKIKKRNVRKTSADDV